MGYGSPKTISDRSMRNCKGDIQELKPTFLVGVPVVWETVKKEIMDQVSKQPALTQKLFWRALAVKNFLFQTGIPGTAVLDAVVSKKIKAATGGRLKICMSGSNPVAKETQHFIGMALCHMIISYGSTELNVSSILEYKLGHYYWCSYGSPPSGSTASERSPQVSRSSSSTSLM